MIQMRWKIYTYKFIKQKCMYRKLKTSLDGSCDFSSRNSFWEIVKVYEH